jgi:hypothetical protein
MSGPSHRLVDDLWGQAMGPLREPDPEKPKARFCWLSKNYELYYHDDYMINYMIYIW